MSLLNLFKKPDWKHKNDDIRAQGVASDDTAELKNQLPTIAQNDSSEIVRNAAVKRLKDYALLAKIANSDKSKQVQNSALKILQAWFSKKQDNEQLTILKTLNDNTTHEIAAANSGNKQIRAYCIEKISKQGLLADLLVAEKERDLRQIILNKINKKATLKRLFKLVKNKDKKILKAIQEKLENDGDKDKILQQKALVICESMEKLIHNAQTSSKKDADDLHQQWLELKKQHNLETLQKRFDGAYRTATLTFDPKQREEFLTQQRQQRIASKIEELNSSLTHAQEKSWEQIQSQISKYSGFDLTHASVQQQQQFAQNLESLKEIRDSKSKKQDLPNKLLAIVDQLDAALKHKYNQPNQIKKFRQLWEENARHAKNNTAFATLKHRFDNAMLKLAEKIEKSAKQREESAKIAVDNIAKVQKLIKDGHLAQAKIAINKIAEHKKIAGQHALIKQHKFEFDTIWNELKELRQWQKWSNDKIRLRLIEELKQLIGTGLHPDALLKKMKQANSQWKDMEEHEKLEGDRFPVRNQELYTQFREVQKALFEPAQKFFEKRSEIWGQELQQVQANVQALHEVDLQATSDRDLAHMVRDAIKQLRNLDSIPPKERGKIAAEIRSGTARIDEHLQESYKIAQRRKEKLIAQAQELIELEDLDAAIEQAKALQNNWKQAGIVHQSTERKLWKSFRKANDAIFNRIKQQREAVKAENQELINQAKKLIQDCEKSITQEHTAHAINSLIEHFKDDFNRLQIENRGIINTATKLISQAEEKITALANGEILATLKLSEKYATIAQQYETAEIDEETAQQKWQQLEKLNDNKLSKSLSKRLANNSQENSDSQATASTLLVAAEYLTGLKTPDEFKEQRLAYQVDELAKRMGGGENLSAYDKAIALLKQWFSLAGIPAEFLKANEKRINTIINSLYDIIKEG